MEVREIVIMTIDELIRRNLLRTDIYQSVLKVMESRLYSYFNGTKDAELTRVLKELSDDNYIDIILYIYRDTISQERIAEIMDKDIATIKRNKKRLILKIYELLEVNNL